MPDFGIMRGFNEKLFGDKLFAGQLPINLGNNFDPEAQAFFDRVTAAGGTLSATEQLAVNTLVKQMKLDGIWTAMKAIYPMVGASAAACAQNLKSASFTGTFSSGWTFSSNGILVNSTSAYFNTNFNPNTQLTYGNSHISLYKNLGTISSTQKISGVYDIAPNTFDFTLAPDRNNSTFYSQGGMGSYVPDTSVGNTSTIQGNGFYVVSRNAANNQFLTKNNTNTSTNTTTDTIAKYPNDNFWIGGTHQVGTTNLILNCLNYRFAFSSIGEYLTIDESDDFYTAVQSFNTTLSRQV
jgi:hypothetical protein